MSLYIVVMEPVRTVEARGKWNVMRRAREFEKRSSRILKVLSYDIVSYLITEVNWYSYRYQYIRRNRSEDFVVIVPS